MQAGRRDRLISIESLVTTRDEYGGEVQVWSPYATAWANKREVSSKEVFQAEQLTALSTVIFTSLYIQGVSETMRLLCEGKTYNIRGVQEIGRRKELQIVADGQ